MPLGHEAIEMAYRKHAHCVLRRAQCLLGSEQEAKEVLHEVFVSLLEHPTQYSAKSTLLTWLYAATTHSCLKRMRANATHRRLLAVNADVLGTSVGICTPEQEVELRRLLERLPSELVPIAVYHYLDNMTSEETALVLGCSRRKVFYLMEQLRQWVRSEESSYGKRTA